MQTKSLATDEITEDLLDTDIARMKPFSSLPATLQAKLRSLKQAPVAAAPEKERELLWIPRSTPERLQATGEGWEGRLDEVLREWLDRQKAS